MKVQMICKYCDRKWIQNIYGSRDSIKTKCLACNDSNIQIRSLEDNPVDYYKGDKPFPSKDNKDTESELDPFHELYFPSGD